MSFYTKFQHSISYKNEQNERISPMEGTNLPILWLQNCPVIGQICPVFSVDHAGNVQKNIGGTSANGCTGAGIYHYLFVRMKQAQTSSIQFDSVCHKKTWVVVIV